MIAVQTAPQIRLVQNNDNADGGENPIYHCQYCAAVEKSDGACPWRGAFLQAAAAQREVTDMTNELLRRNAEKLKMDVCRIRQRIRAGIVEYGNTESHK